MKKAHFNRKKALIFSVILAIALICSALSLSVFAEDNSNNVWTFTSSSMKDPLYVQDYYNTLPRAFEAEVYFDKSYSKSSPIIANYPAYDSRNCFGFQITSDGYPNLYYYEATYNVETTTTVVTKDKAIFKKYNIYEESLGNWVRLAVTNEIIEEVVNGETVRTPVYKLYVNGELKETITSFTEVRDFDGEWSQAHTRELSIGNDASNYFKGQLRNVAVYGTAITADDAKIPAKEHMKNGNSNLLGYYDATMSGNRDRFIKDQTGNGHDAYSAFFERTEKLDDYAYSFAFIGDTQFLIEKDVADSTTKYTSPIFDWIISNKDSKNIQHVFGLGDITDDNTAAQWKYGAQLYGKLGDAKIPYSTILGNHDASNNYNSYFGALTSLVNSIDGTYEEGKIDNYYSKFEVGNHRYMVVGLEYGARDEVLAWANKVVTENGDRRVIVMTHSLFDLEGNWGEKDTPYQTTTSGHYERNNGIEIWNDFISLHENIILAVSGHITSNFYHPKQYTGVNGNVVNTLLIDPQGTDKANNYDTGFVAMFYFSEDGSDVHVECVSTTKTLAAQNTNPDSDDIIFQEENQYDFEINFRMAEGSFEETPYGSLPSYCYTAGNKFAVFTEGEFIGGYNTWNSATVAVSDLFTQNPKADVQLLLLDNHTNTDDALKATALSLAYGKLTIDLNKHTFTRSGTFLNLNIGSTVANSGTANILIKNGSVRTLGNAIINNQISNYNYANEKIWNLTFDNVTLGYADSLSSTKGPFYQAWTNSATSDEAQLGTKTNLTFNNCTFDLKTNAPAKAVTLFALKDDHPGVDKIDVTIKINGGKMLASIDDLKSYITLYTLNEGSDSVTFGANDEGEYIKLITGTTAKDYEHYTGAYPATDGNRYFVEISDDGTESVYELQSLNYTYELLNNGGTKTGTLSLGTDNENAKYLSAVDYPFVLFDQTGKFYNAYDTFLGNSAGLGAAVYYVVNSNSKPTNNTAYLLMRSDYTLTSSEKFDNISHGRESGVVFDMCGHTLTADSSRGKYDNAASSIFNSTIKDWSGSKGGGTTFATNYVVRNGTIKTYSASILYIKSSNQETVDNVKQQVDLSLKSMGWTFNNVTFGLLEGATTDRFIHVANAANTSYSTKMPTLDLTFNDCTFNLDNANKSKAFLIFRTNIGNTARVQGDVHINGGAILTSTLNQVTLENFIYTTVCNLTYGTGSDGKYLSVVLPKGESIDAFNSYTLKTEAGEVLIFNNLSENGDFVTYSLVPKEVTSITFVPKSSITLGSELVYNIYVPKVDFLNSFSVDGVVYTNANVVTLEDGNDYYHVAVTLPADQAARSIVLKVNVTISGKQYSGTFTMSIPKYAKQVINATPVGTEATLVKDVLAYIKAAYIYFDSDDKASAITAIDEILGNYNSEFSKVNGNANSTNGLYGVEILLEETPKVRFILPEGISTKGYTFKADGRTLAFTSGIMTISGVTYNYAEVSLYAYQLIKDITYSNGTVSGNYHINSYYDFIKTHDELKFDDNLITLVEKLYTYCKSAEAYRASVTD